MKKDLLLKTLILFNSIVLVTLLILHFVRDTRIVYVDTARLINNYAGMQDARKAYQQKAMGWKANIDTLAKEVQQQIISYEKERGRMTAKEQKLSQELIRTRQEQLAQYQQALNTQAQQEDSEMTSTVVAQINVYLKKYGEEKGYKIIMAATEYGNIAYAEDELDITDEVLKGLNKEFTGK